MSAPYALREERTHITNETRPAPLPAQRLHRLIAVANAPFAALALGQPQTYVAGLAVRMAAVHGESYVVRLKLPIAADVQLA